MVGKTYLRYVVGPQGGCTVSNAALTVDSSVILPQYNVNHHAGNNNNTAHGRNGRSFPPPRGNPRSNFSRGSAQTSSPSLSAASVLFVPSLEAVRVLSVRSGTILHTLIPADAKMPVEVTSLKVFPLNGASGSAGSRGGNLHHSGSAAAAAGAAASLALTSPHTVIEQEGWMLLVGYSNGCFAVFTCSETTNYGKPVCRFYALGHKVDTNVLALAVDASRTFACSAGQDTDITVWDLMSQEAAYRLRGHRGGVVALHFVPPRQGGTRGPSQHGTTSGGGGGDTFLVSGAADGLVKVWNLSLRQCVQTVVASDAQITSMVMDCEGRRLYCGVRESFIKVYSLDHAGAEKTTKDEVSSMAPARAGGVVLRGGEDDLLVDHGAIPRKYHKPITAFSFSPDWNFLLATTSKTVEVYRVLSTDEVRRKVYRKKRRQQKGQKSKKHDTEAKDPGEEEEEEKGEEGHDDEEARVAKTKAHVQKRPRDDGQEHQDGSDDDDEEEDDGEDPLQTAAEEATLLRTFFLTSTSQPNRKVRSACFIPAPSRAAGGAAAASEVSEDGVLHIAVTFNNNAIQTYTTGLTLSDAVGGATWTLKDLKPRLSFDQQGHQSDIRALAFVENDSALLSMSKEKILMWTLTVRENRLETDHLDHSDFYDAQEANLARVDFKGSLNCCGRVLLNVGPSDLGKEGTVGSAAGGDGVSMAAVSANMCCVGLSDGTVALLDVASSETLFTEPGFHIGGVKAVTKKPDNSGLLSLGADRRLVLWTVGLLKDGRTATLLLATEIELTELPLFAAFSPDNHYLGVGLQNNNIQLFFADSLKPYLSLFGHKLPPTDMAFSSDGTLVASVGTDKSLRFWGTDFGDCHRAIHAHDDYITSVAFVKNTHYVFTVSLDGSVKHWDGDNWTMIQYVRQHQHGLWAVAVTTNATCVATAGNDKCIRCFLRTQDIIFPEEEEERMGQEAMDEEAARKAAMQKLDAADGTVTEVGVAGQQTAATAEAAERIMEALDLVSIEQQRRLNPEDASPRHPLLANMTEWEYLWSVIASVRPSELRHALASLTTVHVDALLNYLEEMLAARAVLDYEIAAKIVLALVMPSTAAAAAGAGGAALALRSAAIHSDASEVMGAKRLERLRRAITDGLDRSVGRVDYNIAGLQFVCQHLQQTEKVKFFDLSKIQGHKKKYHSRALPDGKTE